LSIASTDSELVQKVVSRDEGAFLALYDRFASRVYALTLRVLGDGAAFNTAVVLGFDEEGNMLVARPYAYASSTGTTYPTPLIWAEVYSLHADHAARLRPMEKHQRTVKP